MATDFTKQPDGPQQPAAPQPYAQQAPPGWGPVAGSQPPATQPYQHATGYPVPGQDGPIGKVRSTGVAILLTIVTLGIYPLYWFYAVHDEMERHTGQGLGGGLALLIDFFVGIVMPFVTSNEVGQMYTRRGWRPPVSGLTGLWYFPGALIIVGPLVWFVQTNGAINDYWKALGAR